MGIEIGQFDQTSLLLLGSCAFLLFRERNIFTFLVLALGFAFVGPLAAAIFAALRFALDLLTDSKRPLLIKDAAAVVMLIAGASSRDSMSEYFSFFGLVLFALDLGVGRLGVVSAALMARQLYGHTTYPEVVISVFLLVGVLKELAPIIKKAGVDAAVPYSLGFASLVAMIGVREPVEKYIQDSNFIAWSAAGFVLALGIFLWKHFGADGFFSMGRSIRDLALKILMAPGDWIHEESPFVSIPENVRNDTFEFEGERLFWTAVSLFLSILLLFALSKGGTL